MYSPTLVQDYENGTDQDAYVTADSPVHFLQTLKKDDLERLAEQSVTTIAELGEAEKETIMLARGGVEGEGFDAYRPVEWGKGSRKVNSRFNTSNRINSTGANCAGSAL